MRVYDVMTRDVTAVTQDETVENVIKILATQSLSGLPIVAEDMRVIGFVSESDIIRAAVPGYFSLLQSTTFIPDMSQFFRTISRIKDKPIREFMAHPPLVVNENASLVHVADLMIRHNVKILPVVDEHGRLLGMITRSNVIRAAMEGYL
ncbi:CBS domain-containing protein [Pseudothermotoga sp.]|uniref:CBS domain-containing protein n=1 Tax=Pseudothermotoga sp. TaxID=2033661 RepID=UPI00299ADD07|nr:CBS domain-containing protein [Pseudothermotoga sp.]MCX7813001.1 CBS domain-containing protein [Pseudothermotoga sp.]MDW8139760.1 CBS domain-containing protein [Pseudothermotoga sp.]